MVIEKVEDLVREMRKRNIRAKSEIIRDRNELRTIVIIAFDEQRTDITFENNELRFDDVVVKLSEPVEKMVNSVCDGFYISMSGKQKEFRNVDYLVIDLNVSDMFDIL